MPVPGFTKRQRLWTLRRDGHQCSFLTYNYKTDKWERCKNTKYLDVHHIVPRGFYVKHLINTGWDVNTPENAITLCSYHHRGYRMKQEDSLYVIHLDTEDARLDYRNGNKEAFKLMMDLRKSLNYIGIPYWNTRWDWLFARLATRRNERFTEPYPQRKNVWYLHGGKR